MTNGHARCLRRIWPSTAFKKVALLFTPVENVCQLICWVSVRVSGCLIFPICREHTRQGDHQRVKSVATKEEKPWTKGEAGTNWMRAVSLNARGVACCMGNSPKRSPCFRCSLWLAPFHHGDETGCVSPGRKWHSPHSECFLVGEDDAESRDKRSVSANISERGKKLTQNFISKLQIYKVSNI